MKISEMQYMVVQLVICATDKGGLGMGRESECVACMRVETTILDWKSREGLTKNVTFAKIPS